MNLFQSDIVKAACEKHLRRIIASFTARGAQNLDYQVGRWLGLIEGGLWTETFREALSAWKEAEGTGEPVSRFFVEEGSLGRVMVVTVAHWASEMELVKKFPPGGYGALIRPFRKRSYASGRWNEREFVHWIFCITNDISVSLFYLWSFEFTVELTMAQMSKAKVIAPPVIAPLELVGGEMGALRLVGEITQADAEAVE